MQTSYDDSLVTETGYNARLKRQCLYNVLNRYSHLLRPGIYPDDTRTAFLMTMCRLIDRSAELNAKPVTNYDDDDDDNDDDDTKNNKDDTNKDDTKNDNDDTKDDNDDTKDDKDDTKDDNDEIWKLNELSVADTKGLFDETKSAAVPGPLSANERLNRLERVFLNPELNPYI